MKKTTILTTLSCFVLAAVSASAMDKQFVDQFLESAKNIERDATTVKSALKSKSYDVAEVQKKIETMDGDVAKLRSLISDFEATNPQISTREKAEWDRLKLKVQLLDIFHGEKKKLAGEDLHGNRSLVRLHADGIAKRAQVLQQSAAKLQRAPLS